MNGSGWYQVKIERGVVCVVLHGEFDLVESAELESALMPLVDQHRARVEVDLADVQFFGSSGLRALLAAHERAKECESSLTVIAESEVCTRVFDLAGVAELLRASAPPAG
jgi:anti-anti-sigma factor